MRVPDEKGGIALLVPESFGSRRGCRLRGQSGRVHGVSRSCDTTGGGKRRKRAVLS